MKVLNFRHIGIPTEDIEKSIEAYKRMGFDVKESGSDTINGQRVAWVKMVNAQGMCIELLTGGQLHLAFTVDAVVPEHYYFQAPSGCKIQFGHDPSGVPLEFVEVPNK